MLLGFILLVLPCQRQCHSIGWGYTVPIFLIAVFFRIYVSGCGLWRVNYYPLIKVQLKKVFTAGAA